MKNMGLCYHYSMITIVRKNPRIMGRGGEYLPARERPDTGHIRPEPDHISQGPDRTGMSGRMFRDARPLPPGVGE